MAAGRAVAAAGGGPGPDQWIGVAEEPGDRLGECRTIGFGDFPEILQVVQHRLALPPDPDRVRDRAVARRVLAELSFELASCSPTSRVVLVKLSSWQKALNSIDTSSVLGPAITLCSGYPPTLSPAAAR